MTSENSNGGPVFVDTVPQPDWDDLREDGAMVIDTEGEKLGIYPGAGGDVILMSQEFDETDPHFTVVSTDRVPALIAVLTNAAAEATEIWKGIEAEIAAYEAGRGAST